MDTLVQLEVLAQSVQQDVLKLRVIQFAHYVHKGHIPHLEQQVVLPVMEVNTIQELVTQDAQTAQQVNKRMALEVVV